MSRPRHRAPAVFAACVIAIAAALGTAPQHVRAANPTCYYTGDSTYASGSGSPVTYTGTSLTDTSAAWVVNGWTGYVVTASTTPASSATISSNTSTALTVGSWSNGTPAAGTAYSITTEQVQICHNTGDEGMYYDVPPGFWRFVQQASSTSSTSSAAATMASPSTVNDTIVALAQADSGTTSAVSDTNGDTFTKLVSQAYGAAELSIWSATVATYRTQTVTATFSAAGGQVNTVEYGGLGGVDVSAHASGTSTAPSSGATAATTRQDDLLLGAIGSAQTITAGSGFTSRGNQTGTLNLLAQEELDHSTSAFPSWTGVTTPATGTLGASGSWASIGVAFKLGSYGQIEYNAQPLRTAPNTYRTLVHSEAQKLTDATNCPLDTGYNGIGQAGFPDASNPYQYDHFVPANPYGYQVGGSVGSPGYGWCSDGDSMREASYNATGTSDTTPYTMGPVPPAYALSGSESIAAAGSFYGATTNAVTGSLSSGLTHNTSYTSLAVNSLPFSLGDGAQVQIGTGASTQVVQLAPWSWDTLASGGGLSVNSSYGTISLASANQTALSPGADLTLTGGTGCNAGYSGQQQVVISPAATSLTTAVSAGSSYTSLNVGVLPYQISAGTILTMVASGGSPTQAITVASTAAAGAQTISVNSFTANALYGIGAPVDSPTIPSGTNGATSIPVNPFIAQCSYAGGAGINANGLPQGATTIPVQQFTANAAYHSGTTITLLGDQAGFGGIGNPMTLAGRYYAPYNDSYYYTYFIGENRTDSNPTCPWTGMKGTCGWREELELARTTDFTNWQVYTNNSTPWQSYSSISSSTYPVAVKDQSNNAIVSNYPDTAGCVGGLLGTMDQVYSPADGTHTFRYFYEDHPNTGNWQSDLQTWNLYEREAVVGATGAFDTSGMPIWSAPNLVMAGAPGGGLLDVTKAHGSNRWAVTYTTAQGVGAHTTDLDVEYSADMTTLGHADWLTPLAHLLQHLPANGTDYLNVQTGRQFGAGALSGNPGLWKGNLDLESQPDYMTDRDGNIAAPDVETPGWTRGGMVTWTDFPVSFDDSQLGMLGGCDGFPAHNNFMFGGIGAKVYRAGFDVGSNSTGDLTVNGNFNTQTLTGNSTYDGWTTIDESQPGNGGGTNYPPQVLVDSSYPTGLAALVGPSGSTESVGGSGMLEGVLIPSGSHTATLKLSYWDKCPAAGGDYQAIYAVNLETSAISWIVASQCDNSQTWQTASVDLSSWAGDHAYIYAVTRKVNTSNTAPVLVKLACETWCVSLNVT